MRIKSTATATVFALATAAAPALVQGLDLSFLGPAPLRYFNDADLKLMSDAADQALETAKDEEPVDWRNEQTGNSGTITPVRSFNWQENDCRRLEVVNLSAGAAGGRSDAEYDFCKVEGAWKILDIRP